MAQTHAAAPRTAPERAAASAPKPLRVGIDVGSTTVKVVVLADDDSVLYGDYERHLADIRSTIISVANKALDAVEAKGESSRLFSVVVTGSGGLSVSQWLVIPFIQEVAASTVAVRKLAPETDVAIELGGEDAKITYFTSGVEQRMNGTCAGGTGAFIDQMAALLETDAAGLNELARDAGTLYPIAARCGVFAKTDVQPLINEGARREDIAASIFQAVVSQTISGLACGKPIRGTVAFLGGPLYFLDQLRERFIKTLNLTGDAVVAPKNSQLFVALGAAYSAYPTYSACPAHPAEGEENQSEGSGAHPPLVLAAFRESLQKLVNAEMTEVQRLEPLFKNEAELEAFRRRHDAETALSGDLAVTAGPLFLGLDAGSTTTKAVLADAEGRILWQFYAANAGNPVDLAVRVLKDLYRALPPAAYIARAVSTGYGEALFQAALSVDAGEVETIAHYRAADFFVPGVEFLLDIGGQDMKCLRMKDGAVASIQLNEACSAGCGSFLENFARSLGVDIRGFSAKALLAEHPVDLGSRCTVFMNSRVKQAQKEGATVADISAGLSYSVIKNALFKVIKLRNTAEIGRKVVVQGGTFSNDAVLRAFERISGLEVYRPDVAGLMGAYGAALIAHDQWQDLRQAFVEENGGALPEIRSQLAGPEALESFGVSLDLRRCGKCANNCLLTINTFTMNSSVRRFITGNRCERGAESEHKKAGASIDASNAENAPRERGRDMPTLPNLFDWKYRRVFDYAPLASEQAPRGEVGIPRVLNLYENYPLWFTFFTELGFRVCLSPRSTRAVYEAGLETIPSESVCYPGKIAHGHIESLLKAGVQFIFYPCVPYEQKEDAGAGNHYNCPIVTSYPEALRNNIDALRHREGIVFLDPFLPIYDRMRLAERLNEEVGARFGIPQADVNRALGAAWREQAQFQREVQEKGEEALEEIIRYGARGVVLAGRPYHLDSEINHGIPELLAGLGLAVFTEDSVAHLGRVERPMRIIDQWTYHNRLYRAAAFAADMPNLELVQITSFGCGLDAVTADQVDEILKSRGKLYTLLKIDEGSNLGAVRIRIRSLLAAVRERERRRGQKPPPRSAAFTRRVFTKQMKATHTIIAPQMSPIHFRLVQKAFEHSGHRFVVLPDAGSEAVEAGLQFVNNDACYPSILVTGQMIAALKSGRYDLSRVSLMITQTGGGCRATNYIGFIRRALADAGFGHIPVISLSASGLESNPGFRITLSHLHRSAMAIMLGDLFMRVLYRTRPYEAEVGAANRLYEAWNARAEAQLRSLSVRGYHRLIRGIVREFDALPLRPARKPRVGVVGEILVKFHPAANNDIFGTLEREGAECVVPDLADFFFYTFSTGIFRHEQLAFPRKTARNARLCVWVLELYRRHIRKALARSRRFDPPASIYRLMNGVGDIVQLGNIMGEGWFLTAEMVELLESGVPNIACVQPFACLPNHVTGKGMIKELRARFPESNIAAIDYDPGASEVNQLNRLKLLLSNAKNGRHPDERRVDCARGNAAYRPRRVRADLKHPRHRDNG